MFEKVRDIIVDTLSCDADKVTMEASLADDLGAASLDAVELNMALEDNLGVAISDEELEEEYKRLAEQYHMDVDKVKAAVTADSIRKEQSYHKAEHVVYDSAKVGKAPAKKKSTKKKAEESAEGEEKPKKTARKGTSRKKVEETAEAAVEKTEE